MDNIKLMEWYAQDRFPLFAKSDLFREYRLIVMIKSFPIEYDREYNEDTIYRLYNTILNILILYMILNSI